MMRWLLVLLAVGCHRRELPEAIQRAEAAIDAMSGSARERFHADGLVIAGAGVYLDGVKLTDTTDAALAATLLHTSVPPDHRSLIAIDGARSAQLVDVIRATANDNWRDVPVGGVSGTTLTSYGSIEPSRLGAVDNKIRISVLVQPDVVWIGRSKVFEFIEVKQLDTLKAKLVDQRDDPSGVSGVEFAVEGDMPVARVLEAIGAVDAVFHKISFLAPAELAARPTL